MDLARIVEALLFAADGPLTEQQILEVVPEADETRLGAALEELRTFYDETERGFMLARIAGGHQLLTRPVVAPWVEKLLVGRRRQRLSRAALEVLAIVAYRQPVTRGDIETVRGVDCGGTLRTLLERRLVAIKGRAPTVGHPLLYVTSDRFLEHFGISSLRDLPKLEEFAALVDADEARAELLEAGLLEPADPATGESDGESDGERDGAGDGERDEDEAGANGAPEGGTETGERTARTERIATEGQQDR